MVLTCHTQSSSTNRHVRRTRCESGVPFTSDGTATTVHTYGRTNTQTAFRLYRSRRLGGRGSALARGDESVGRALLLYGLSNHVHPERPRNVSELRAAGRIDAAVRRVGHSNRREVSGRRRSYAVVTIDQQVSRRLPRSRELSVGHAHRVNSVRRPGRVARRPRGRPRGPSRCCPRVTGSCRGPSRRR